MHLLYRSIIGGLYTHAGEDVTKQFIHDHILSENYLSIKCFNLANQPENWVRLCEKLNFTEPVEIRLIAETVRLSSHAIYVAGAFSGVEKLGRR